MSAPQIVSRDEWTRARLSLLEQEKQFSRARDQLSAERRTLPWERVEQEYEFDTPDGKQSLAELFNGHNQLVIYHFMFDPDWESGCKSCSFWADTFNGIAPHLAARDTAFAAVSRAPLAVLQAFADRLGWDFRWVSSAGSDFNFDYHVSFRPDDLAAGAIIHNYRPRETKVTELPGVSVFAKTADGAVCHTYSCYERGLDILNAAYNYLDLVPKGRDEDELPHPQSWVRLHDEYGT